MARYQNIMFQLITDSYLNSQEDLIQLLKETTAANPLGGIFFAALVSGGFIFVLNRVRLTYVFLSTE